MKYFAGALIIIIWSIGCLLIGKYYLAETEYIEVEQGDTSETTFETKYEKLEKKNTISLEDYNILLEKYNGLIDLINSPLYFTSYTQDNTLYVTAGDNNKSATGKFKIKVTNRKKLIVQLGLSYQYDIGYSLKPACFYDFGFIAVGIGVIGNEHYPGIEILAQKTFVLF